MVSGNGCGLWLSHSLEFSLTFFSPHWMNNIFFGVPTSFCLVTAFYNEKKNKLTSLSFSKLRKRNTNFKTVHIGWHFLLFQYLFLILGSNWWTSWQFQLWTEKCGLHGNNYRFCPKAMFKAQIRNMIHILIWNKMSFIVQWKKEYIYCSEKLDFPTIFLNLYTKSP